MQPTNTTREEVQALKRGWEKDPCWDLETTQGFEAYREELAAFATQKKQEWASAHYLLLERKAYELGVPGNHKLAEYVLNLEHRLNEMNLVLENIYFR